jgi:hypothetical protein
MLHLESPIEDHKIEFKKWIEELDNEDHYIIKENPGLNALGLNGNSCLTFKADTIFKEFIYSLDAYPELIKCIPPDKRWYNLFIDFLKTYTNIYQKVQSWICNNNTTLLNNIQ